MKNPRMSPTNTWRDWIFGKFFPRIITSIRRKNTPRRNANSPKVTGMLIFYFVRSGILPGDNYHAPCEMRRSCTRSLPRDNIRHFCLSRRRSCQDNRGKSGEKVWNGQSRIRYDALLHRGSDFVFFLRNTERSRGGNTHLRTVCRVHNNGDKRLVCIFQSPALSFPAGQLIFHNVSSLPTDRRRTSDPYPFFPVSLVTTEKIPFWRE